MVDICPKADSLYPDKQGVRAFVVRVRVGGTCRNRVPFANRFSRES